MKSSNGNGWLTKIYLYFNNFYYKLVNPQISKEPVKKDLWLVVGIMEFIESLAFFVEDIKKGKIPISGAIFSIIAIGLLFKNKILFWIGFVISILILVLSINIHNTLTDYFYIAYSVLMVIIYCILWNKIHKGKRYS